MARGQLSFIGVSYQKPSQGDVNGMTDIIEKTAINRTAYGRVNTVQDAQTVIEALRAAPQTLYTQEKILDYENKKEQLVASAQDMMMSKDNFQETVQSKLKEAAKNNINNPRQMMAEYAQIYSEYADAYDGYIEDKVLNQYGSDTKLPADVVNFGTQLREQASFHAGLYNAYNFADSQGRLGANAFGDSLDTNAVAMVVQTNPMTGKISNVQYVPANQVPDGFMRTDIQSNVYGSEEAGGVGQNKLPVFVQANEVPDGKGGVTLQARLGSLKFSGQKKGEGGSATILEIQNIPGWFNDAPINSVRKDGLYLNDQSFTFDKHDIPNQSLVRAGSKTFFQGGDGGLYEIKGADDSERQANLDAYYRKWNVNPANVRTFFADKTYLSKDDGTPRVTGIIDKSTTQVDPSLSPAGISTGGSIPMSAGQGQTRGNGLGIADAFFAAANPVMAPATLATRALGQEAADGISSFFGVKNRPSSPDEPVTSRAGNISAPDVVEAGKSFFRGVGQKLGIG
jgi:hypothetical protein